jgi:hypothetical protein
MLLFARRELLRLPFFVIEDYFINYVGAKGPFKVPQPPPLAGLRELKSFVTFKLD